jgi:hypothetical protein
MNSIQHMPIECLFRINKYLFDLYKKKKMKKKRAKSYNSRSIMSHSTC